MVLPKDELYSGVEAQQYESRRAGTKTWRRENKIVESFLRRAGRGDEATVLDVPVGTGRFLDLYEALGLRVIGFDISGDMLEQARKRQRRDSFLGVADIRMPPLPAGAADVAVCIRLLHLVDGQMRDAAIAELGRVVRTHGYVILGTRMHEWMMPDSPARKRIGDLFRVAQRTLRFRTGSANSRSHSRRALMRAFDRSTLAIDSREIATRYPDGSYYAIFLLQPTTGPGKRRNRTVTIELFGLPGSGKTTLARSALKAGRVEYSDGYASMGELSVWGCVRRRPLAAIRLLIRLLACGREAMRPPAKEVIVTALRQGVAASTAGSPICVFEEGTCHEAWRQLVQGHRLSRRLLQAIIPAADLTIILDPPVELVKERLSAKPHPGPISRELIGQDLGSELWDSALVAFKAIQETIRTGKTESLRFNNDGDAEAGRVRFERITLDFSRQTVNPSV